MADYKKLTETTVSKTYSIIRTIDLESYTKELAEIEDKLKGLPKVKTVPDQETLEFWNEFNVNSDEEIELLERKAYIEGLFAEIKAANQMPDKYIEPIKIIK